MTQIDIIPFDAGEAQLDWIGFTDALAAVTTCPKRKSPIRFYTGAKIRCLTVLPGLTAWGWR